MFFMFGGFDLLMGAFVWLSVPETKGISLEKMDELFGVARTSTGAAGDKAEPGGIVTVGEQAAGKR